MSAFPPASTLSSTVNIHTHSCLSSPPVFSVTRPLVCPGATPSASETATTYTNKHSHGPTPSVLPSPRTHPRSSTTRHPHTVSPFFLLSTTVLNAPHTSPSAPHTHGSGAYTPPCPPPPARKHPRGPPTWARAQR
ncbi:hypothetical protein DENSPDRAFT_496133 [Dentipellis sp. KUC8613]|nr:hypothetical protein DENSPDRAFT_496133 [Dentipellis sp. KUC8613]